MLRHVSASMANPSRLLSRSPLRHLGLESSCVRAADHLEGPPCNHISDLAEELLELAPFHRKIRKVHLGRWLSVGKCAELCRTKASSRRKVRNKQKKKKEKKKKETKTR